jgi:lipoate-protein ligase B
VSPAFLRDRNIQVLSTDRGGRASYHGPGQLVGFPIMSLKRLYGDARAVKRFTEELLLGLAHACAVLGVKSVNTRHDFPGLWTNRGMLASVGITVKDGYIFHGFSLNVTQACVPGFSLIQPCGIADCPITTLEQEGVRLENTRELATKLLPYLTVIQGEEVLKGSKAVSYESSYANLVSTVSRSQMAIDHFRSNLESLRNGE